MTDQSFYNPFQGQAAASNVDMYGWDADAEYLAYNGPAELLQTYSAAPMPEADLVAGLPHSYAQSTSLSPAILHLHHTPQPAYFQSSIDGGRSLDPSAYAANWMTPMPGLATYNLSSEWMPPAIATQHVQLPAQPGFFGNAFSKAYQAPFMPTNAQVTPVPQGSLPLLPEVAVAASSAPTSSTTQIASSSSHSTPVQRTKPKASRSRASAGATGRGKPRVSAQQCAAAKVVGGKRMKAAKREAKDPGTMPAAATCPIPGCGAKLRWHMSRHIRTHGPRDLPCWYPNCNSAFTREDALRRHVAIHFRSR
ncbi:hypothetical protein AURDEDRAFT_161618 [Auricularia subglabra TFB-10046 SS5]|nr:hypothetical protein AURDEDRAFT_161618 [Auricularia subglabra TFB-10046 SS5]